MIDNTANQSLSNFFAKYKNWIRGFIGLHLISSVLILGAFAGVMVYLYVSNDVNFHPYKIYIVRGYHEGLNDGNKDKSNLSGESMYLKSTPWYQYDQNTIKLKNKVTKEVDEYLTQFPKNERGMKRAEMKQQGIKLPQQQKYEKRFKDGPSFYADYVDQRVKRENYANEEEYQNVLRQEAWKVGYEFGYAEGRRWEKEFAEKWR